jgi:hypothetical protein
MSVMRVAVLLLIATVGVARAAVPLAPQAEFFEKRIRPVLAEHCFSCHGADKQRAGLRLDSRSAMLKGGENGPAVKPGDPDASLLLRAVKQTGDLKMPPKSRLTAQAVADLETWIKLGAPWPELTASTDAEAWKKHWAFQPLRNPPLPAVKNVDWPRNDVDRFLLAGLEAKQLAPSPVADRRTLLRRVTFDLLGLPPTSEEVAAFLKDGSPEAFAKVIDRLLASPHYGERWGRHWLDVARYADTKGYVFFEDANYPWAWTYRDYVIEALNRDLPYDRFVLEQIAADRITHDNDRRALRALGFITAGGRFMSNPYDILDDRIDVVTRGLLGLTVTCARCHDHKFDPIPTRDYYSLYGVFASSVEPATPPLYQEPPKTPGYEKFAKELEAREKKLTDFVRLKQSEVVQAAKTRAAEYLLAAEAQRRQPSLDDFMLLADGNDLNPTMIVRWQSYLARTRKESHPVWAPWHAFADLDTKDWPAQAAMLATRFAANADGKLNPRVAKLFEGEPPAALGDVAKRYGQLLNDVEKRFQESKSPLTDPHDEELLQVFHGPDAAPNVPFTQFGELALLPDRPAQAKVQEFRKAVEQWRASGPDAPPRAMALEDAATPYEPRVFRRGNPNNVGEPVPRQFLALLTGDRRQPFRDGSGRLELARAIASRDNPLTARVIVNRVWMHHFGQGLVRTPSDFGLRSEPPSHPELFDHLATWFMDNGWSLKKLHRLLVLSAAYQQSSDDRPDARRIDPENRLLWRANRRRLDFESTRDALLAVSGRLDRTVGGPSVKNILNPGSTRRTLYGFVDRLSVPGLYRTFDYPSPDTSSPQRDSTTVAPQALFFLNHPFVLDCARSVLRRPEVSGAKEDPARVERLYQCVFGRVPEAEELRRGLDFLAGEKGTPAAWERYTQALLLTNEFVFLD